jgi:ATP-binding cassette subfamily B protein RaxB
LLLGLLTPTDGEILVGGRSIQSIGLSNFRQMTGSVMQDDLLFAGSIADNIAFFDPSPDSERVEACARMAAIDQEIDAMPMQYMTLIGDLGTGLSGGQKQRVVLARALYRSPRILVLDEATSHLDLVNELTINNAIARLPMTRMIVAHRPDTIAMAERIVLLDSGEICHDQMNSARSSAFSH